ncbi:MAG TPA: dehydrogenase, partial [Nitrososphaeraceae archaeon]
DKISKGEHPEFSTVDKIGIFIRGALNKKLAENLAYTSRLNEKLVEHYYNYPDSPETFIHWQQILYNYLDEAFSKFK